VAARVIDSWCLASLEAGWATPGEWWTPAIEPVVEALLDDEDHLSACAELAAHRARSGCPLAETLDDLGALFAVARLGTPPFETVRAVSVAWVDAAQQQIEAAGCTHPGTGLGTAAHVEARLAEMYAEGRRHGYSPAETHALVVIELPAVAQVGDPWDAALRMSDVSDCLRTVFDAGEVMGVAGQSRVVVVVPRAADLPRTIEGLRRMLQDWRSNNLGGPGPIIWMESLPTNRPGAERLLASLCG
jgi:GGDEF domain-containing protein